MALLMENQQGIKNLYFGHPFSKETYTNSVMLRTPVSEWIADLDGIYSGKTIEFMPDKYEITGEVETEHRVIRGTTVMFIGDYEKIVEMENDHLIYTQMKAKATVKVNNPDYLEFDAYTKKVLDDPLQNLEDVTSMTPELAKKYMEYAVKYDKDKKYSDKLVIKPYFLSSPSGWLILTDDFVDYNIDLSVDPENGVVGAKVTLSENTSKYTDMYKEI